MQAAQILLDPKKEFMKALIVHNHWIHYKDLLFREMAAIDRDFLVFFTSRSSTQRFSPPAFGDLPYDSIVGQDGSYEAAKAGVGMRTLWLVLATQNPRLVIVSGWYDTSAWVAWTWSRLHRRPCIIWAESNQFDKPRSPWKEVLKRIFVRGCTAAHVYGLSNKAYLVALGMEAEKIFIKRAVVNVDLFRLQAAKVSEVGVRKLIFVGRLAPEKNLHLLFRGLVALSVID